MNPIMHCTLSGECVHHNRRLNTELAFKAAAHSTFHYSFVLMVIIKMQSQANVLYDEDYDRGNDPVWPVIHFM